MSEKQRMIQKFVYPDGTTITDEEQIRVILGHAARVEQPNALQLLQSIHLTTEIITSTMLYIGELENEFPHLDNLTDSNSIFKQADLEIAFDDNSRRGMRNMYHFSIETAEGPVTIRVTQPINLSTFGKDLTDEEKTLVFDDIKKKVVDELNKLISSNSLE